MARESFARDLAEISDLTADLADEVRAELVAAVAALADRDAAAAARAVSIEQHVAEGTADLEHRCAVLIARQGPVADDLRLLLALFRLAPELERSAHLAGHVARAIGRVRAEDLPDGLVDLIRAVAADVDEVYDLAIAAFRARDRALSERIGAADDRVDTGVAALLRTVVEAGDSGRLGAEEVLQLGLLGRYFERIADHAVTMSTRTLYLLGVESGEGPAAVRA